MEMDNGNKKIDELGDKLANNLEKIGNKLGDQGKNAGEKAARGLANGLKNGQKEVEKAAENIADTAADTINKNIKKSSMSEAINSMVKDLKTAIENSTETLKSSLVKMANSFNSDTGLNFSGITSSLTDALNNSDFSKLSESLSKSITEGVQQGTKVATQKLSSLKNINNISWGKDAADEYNSIISSIKSAKNTLDTSITKMVSSDKAKEYAQNIERMKALFSANGIKYDFDSKQKLQSLDKIDVKQLKEITNISPDGINNLGVSFEKVALEISSSLRQLENSFGELKNQIESYKTTINSIKSNQEGFDFKNLKTIILDMKDGITSLSDGLDFEALNLSIGRFSDTVEVLVDKFGNLSTAIKAISAKPIEETQAAFDKLTNRIELSKNNVEQLREIENKFNTGNDKNHRGLDTYFNPDKKYDSNGKVIGYVKMQTKSYQELCESLAEYIKLGGQLNNLSIFKDAYNSDDKSQRNKAIRLVESVRGIAKANNIDLGIDNNIGAVNTIKALDIAKEQLGLSKQKVSIEEIQNGLIKTQEDNLGGVLKIYQDILNVVSQISGTPSINIGSNSNSDYNKNKKISEMYESAKQNINTGDNDLTDVSWQNTRKMLNERASAVDNLKKQISTTTDAKVLDDLNLDLLKSKEAFVSLYDSANQLFGEKLNTKGNLKQSTKDLYSSIMGEVGDAQKYLSENSGLDQVGKQADDSTKLITEHLLPALGSIVISLNSIKSSSANVVDSLRILSESLNGLDFNVSLNMGSGKNPIQQMSEYGSKAREIINVQKQAYKELQDIMMTGNNLPRGMLSGKPELFEMIAHADDTSGSYIEKMNRYQALIKEFQSFANSKGIDISSWTQKFGEQVSGFDKNIQDVEKIMSGETEIANQADRLKSLFGGLNNISLDGLILQFDRVIDKLDELTNKFSSGIIVNPNNSNIPNPTNNTFNEADSKDDIVKLEDNLGREIDENNSKLLVRTKLLDDQKKIITLFHFSDETFDNFDESKNGKNGSAYGKGAYLSKNPTFKWASMGDKLSQWYANVENTFDYDNDSLSTKEIETLISNFGSNLDEEVKDVVRSKLSTAGNVLSGLERLSGDDASMLESLGYDSASKQSSNIFQVFNPKNLIKATDIEITGDKLKELLSIYEKDGISGVQNFIQEVIKANKIMTDVTQNNHNNIGDGTAAQTDPYSVDIDKLNNSIGKVFDNSSLSNVKNNLQEETDLIRDQIQASISEEYNLLDGKPMDISVSKSIFQALEDKIGEDGKKVKVKVQKVLYEIRGAFEDGIGNTINFSGEFGDDGFLGISHVDKKVSSGYTDQKKARREAESAEKVQRRKENKKQEDIDSAITNTTNRLNNISGEGKYDSFGKYFDDTSRKIDDLNQKLRDGDIDVKNYNSEVGKLIATLKSDKWNKSDSFVKLVDPNDVSKAKDAMLELVNSENAAEIKSTNFSKEGKQLTATLLTQDNQVKKLTYAYDELTGAIVKVSESTSSSSSKSDKPEGLSDIDKALQKTQARLDLIESKSGNKYNAFGNYFSEAKKQIEELNATLQKDGNIDAYRLKVNEIFKGLNNNRWNVSENNLIQIDPNNIEDAKEAMMAYVQQLGNATVQSTSFSNNGKTLNATVKTEAGNIETLKLTYDSLTGSINRMVTKTTKNLSFFDIVFGGMKKKFAEVMRYFLSFASIYRVFGIIRNGVTYIKELDTALTELKLVTRKSTAELDSFKEAAQNVADEVGSTTATITKSSTEWARLGYSISDSLDLASQSAKLAKVGFMEVADATTYMTSSIQAFYGKDISNGIISAGDAAEQISDKFVKVGKINAEIIW